MDVNLVNTTMLESTLAQYRKVITNTVNIEPNESGAGGFEYCHWESG